jgi:predicted DNA-binding transcriptional regulator YafY
MRADRLLSILLHLQVHHRMTARELAKRLEVSERTIHRDMEALSMAGVPVRAARGTGGGWELMEEYHTDLTGLNEAEIQTLFLSGSQHLLTDLGLHQASEAAFIKLLAALPSISRHNAEHARQHIYIDVTGWHHTADDVSYLPILQEAIWQEHKLLLTYKRGDDSVVERLVDPLGLVAKGSRWYLVAAIDGGIRTYRVSRVCSAVITDQPAERPKNFDLADYWQQSTSRFVSNLPSYLVTIRIEADFLEEIYRSNKRVERVDAPGAEGKVTVQLRFESDREACGYILSYGPEVEIIEPQELRESIIAQARSVLAYYEEQVTSGSSS